MNSVGHLRVEGNARVQVGDSHSNVHHHYEASRGDHDIDRRNDFLRRLNTTPYEERKNRNPKRVDGTCEWFTAHHFFQNWQKEISALLWVSADPGCGKSVLARYLVDEVIPSEATRRTCYFFFKDDFDDQKTSESALRSILHQLFVQEPTLLSEDILLQYGRENDHYLSSFSKLWALLVEIAGKYEHGEIVCVLDALDECEGHTPLTEALTRLYGQDRNASRLKFILTSRPYRKHQRELRELVQSQPTIHLRGDSQVEADKIAAEITIAVRQRADGLCNRLPIFLEERQVMEEELAKIEHRTYLWVDLVFNHLENAVFQNKHELRTCIYDLPQTVEEAYEKILQKSADANKAKKIFHIIMAAERPLLLAEMAALLALREDHLCHQDLERDILIHESLSIEIREACGLFIIINDLKIFFLHQTAREFLLQAPGQLSAPGWQHSIDTQISHLIMSRICIQYLWFPELQRLEYYPKTAHHLETLQSFVLLEYAAENWTFHYRQARDSDARLQSLAVRLCNIDLDIAKIWMYAHMWRDPTGYPTDTGLFELPKGPLTVASCFGLDGLVNHMLQQDKHNCLNYKSPEMLRSALSWAVRTGRDRVVRLLLERVPNWRVTLGDKFHTPITTIVNHKDAGGRTPLSRAAGCFNTDIVRQLVEKGARIRARDNNKYTPLLQAVESGNAEIVDFLLTCDAGSAVKSEQLRTGDQYGQSPISVAVINTDWQIDIGVIIRLLLDHGADINAPNKNGGRALGLAVGRPMLRKPQMVKLLLDCGADVNASDRDGTTALELAFRTGRPSKKVVKVLLDHGADVNASRKDGTTALVYILTYNRPEAKSMTLSSDSDSDLNTLDDHGTRGFYSLKHATPEIVKLLLDYGANIEALSRYGNTPLIAASITASYDGKLEILVMLLDRGANIEAPGRQGDTALIAASKYSELGTVTLLLDRGANIEASNRYGRTALIAAAERGKLSTVKLLLDRGADVNARDVNGKTALTYALRRKSRWRNPLGRVDQSSKSLAKLLTDCGAVI